MGLKHTPVGGDDLEPWLDARTRGETLVVWSSMHISKGGITMKVRKLSLIVALVVLGAILLAAPVQAERTVVPYTCEYEEILEESYGWYQTGGVLHITGLIRGKMSCDTPMLDGGTMVTTIKIAYVPGNPHPDPVGLGWGPVVGKWRMEVPTTAGQPTSGWQGVIHQHPWSDPDKWPEVMVLWSSGNGFGLYQGMHMEGTVVGGTTPTQDQVLTGTISLNKP
jgi:hypothetical protein